MQTLSLWQLSSRYGIFDTPELKMAFFGGKDWRMDKGATVDLHVGGEVFFLDCNDMSQSCRAANEQRSGFLEGWPQREFGLRNSLQSPAKKSE